MENLECKLVGQDLVLVGKVWVVVEDVIFNMLLSLILVDLVWEFLDIELEVLIDNDVVNFSYWEVDFIFCCDNKFQVMLEGECIVVVELVVYGVVCYCCWYWDMDIENYLEISIWIVLDEIFSYFVIGCWY